MQGERFDYSSSFARIFLLFVVVTFKQAEIPKHISSEVAKPFFCSRPQTCTTSLSPN